MKYDLVVIGAGSGGLAAAKRAAKHGANVAVIEGDQIGGTCVIRGCVPKKLLMYSSLYSQYFANAKSFGHYISEKEFDAETLLSNIRNEVNRLSDIHNKSLKSLGVHLFSGWASFIDAFTVSIYNQSTKQTNKISASNFLIAVGGYPVKPAIKGSEFTWVSDDIFKLKKFPKSIIIVGGGYIACEFSCILNSLGVDVVQLVRSKNLLNGFDLESVTFLERQMSEKGINTIFSQEIKSIDSSHNVLECLTTDNHIYKSEAVLFAIGRTPNTDRLGLDSAGVITNKSAIPVDQYNRTNISHIYAIGDVTNRVRLTPVAIDEGRALSDRLFNFSSRKVNYENIPCAVFSYPEFASVGYSEELAIEEFGSNNIKVYRSSFRAMSQSLSKKSGKCLLKLIVLTETGKVLGCQMVGEHASEIIQMCAIPIQMEASKADFDSAMALHPTIAEEFVTMV